MAKHDNKGVAHGAAGRAGFEISAVCRGPVNPDVMRQSDR